ncbi:hypothetical protein ACFE04_025961 [Oxalis oulophora]
MGAFLSLNAANRKRVNPDTSLNPPNKRLKLEEKEEDNPRLIPTLPDDMSIQILARVPRKFYLTLRLVSHKWKDTLTSPQLFQLRKQLGTTEEWLCLLTKSADDRMTWHALDPVSRTWQKLPLMPYDESRTRPSRWNVMGQSSKIADAIRALFGRKASLDEVPICGCAIGVLHGCLYLVGGLSISSTMSSVWRFDAIQNKWTKMPSMFTGRAYCKTSILNNKLYVAGGVYRGRGSLLPLQSAEVFDPCTSTWSEIPNMPFSKVHALPNGFLADMLRPMATGMTSHNGKLFVPQCLYAWPFVVDVGGEIYDPETNSWSQMPKGMGEGWPARQAGTKLGVVVDNELYAFDPSTSLDSGNIKVYDEKQDSWEVVIGKLPIYDSADSEAPYLLASFHGKLHVITKDKNHRIAVFQADLLRAEGPSSSTLGMLIESYGSGLLRDESPSSSTLGTLIETAGSGSSPGSETDSEAELELESGSESYFWKVIANRDVGSDELMSCQVIGI